MEISRRGFLALSSAIGASLLLGNNAEAVEGKYATLIDVTKCDGCKDEPIPRCVKACREYNKDRFPEPKKPIQPYWPRKTYEDWSDKKDKIDTLTPYNWIFVQKLNVDGQEINIPRRCMHCDNPPCVRECPFGALTKQPEGNSVINDKICFGGAKCRDVCPWHIPQRQAGVGIYLQILPKYAGGGVMYFVKIKSEKARSLPALQHVETDLKKMRFSVLMKEKLFMNLHTEKLKKKDFIFMEINKMEEHQRFIFQKFLLKQ